MTDFNNSTSTRIRRIPKRGGYERETIYGTLDKGMISHLGLARVGDTAVLHSPKADCPLRRIESGNPVIRTTQS